ncbi:MAG: hypothetical protein F2574_01260 [Actinobacteria bacterium]|nr:hypothetical protein [Actinomycetota bacterium]
MTENGESIASEAANVSSSSSLTTRQRITLAALGGIYLSLTVAWLFATQANRVIVDDRFQQSMTSFGAFFAIIASPLYFFTTLVLIRNWPGRVLTLLIGLALLFPFPLFWGVVPA